MGSLFNSIGGALGGWMVHPALFLAGAALVSVPILIHLLNKRKFKLIDWAAMDFLLEADKRNRRRVRLENLLLLLLRCLAVLLIGLLLARPFLSAGLGQRLLGTVRYERVVLLDDSLSMNARQGATTHFALARKALQDWVVRLASDATDDTLTLLCSSNPQRPVFQEVHVDDQTVADLTRELEELTVSDQANDGNAALLELEKLVSARPGDASVVVYLVSDLRSRDYQVADASSSTTSQNGDGASAVIRRLAEQSVGCYLVDAAGDSADVENLTLASIEPEEKVLVAGVPTRFAVTVANHGRLAAKNVTVRLTAGESLPLQRRIASIPAGETVTEAFTILFAAAAADGLEDASPEPVALRAELDLGPAADADHLADDDQRFYAANVQNGIRTLLVDGDPAAAYARSETFFLERALAPPGDVRSGVNVEVVTDVEFETTRLDDYQVIMLCNLYRLGEQRRDELRRWVADGGGLVMLLGDQVDQQLFNEELYADGNGLAPFPLDGVAGDSTEQEWVFFQVAAENHPVLRIFAGDQNPFIEQVKVFRWWRTAAPGASAGGVPVVVSARFTDVDASPAMVEKPLGKGRVVALTTAADLDWSDWAQDAASYLVAMQELVRYVAPVTAGERTLAVGRPLTVPLDLTQYRWEALLTTPEGTETTLQPHPDPDRGSEDQTRWQVRHEKTDRRGFYRLKLTDNSGQPETVLLAANIDPGEGDLRRADLEQFEIDLGDAPVQIISGENLSALASDAAQGELWRWILGLLVVALCGEQLLGWWFGRKR